MTEKTEVEKTKGEVLNGLEAKIEAARADVEETRTAASTFEAGVSNRLRDDAVGGPKYPASDQREDSGVLVGLEQEARDAAKALAVLESLLPAARADAAREALVALGEALVAFDTSTLTPALRCFQLGWNAMLGSLEDVETCFRSRAELEAEFSAVMETLPVGERSVLFPPAPPVSHAGVRNVLTMRVGDSSRFLGGLGRFVIQESDLRGQDRAPVLTIAPDAPDVAPDIA